MDKFFNLKMLDKDAIIIIRSQSKIIFLFKLDILTLNIFKYYDLYKIFIIDLTVLSTLYCLILYLTFSLNFL